MAAASQILPFLYLGGKDEAKSLRFLHDSGIVTIVNCTPLKSADPAGVPNYHEDDRRFRYHRFALVDNIAENILPTLKQAVELIERSRHYGNVLVHCRQGVSRSAAIVSAYLIRYRGMSLAASLAFLKKRRPVVRPNEAFIQQLEHYEADVAELRRLGGVVLHEDIAEGAAVGDSAPTKPLAGSKRRARESHEAIAPALTLGVRVGGRDPVTRVSVGVLQLDEAPPSSRAPCNPVALCEECGQVAASVRCSACDVTYCTTCDADAHSVPSIGDHRAQRAPLAMLGSHDSGLSCDSHTAESTSSKAVVCEPVGCRENSGV